jgi:hypothetical protein
MSSIPSPSLFSVLKFPRRPSINSKVRSRTTREAKSLLSADAVPEQLLAIQCLTCRLFIAIQIRGMSFFKLAPIPVVFLQVPIAKQGHIIL